jgi:alpha-ketoglutarate-dependent taurine dioxygenase
MEYTISRFPAYRGGGRRHRSGDLVMWDSRSLLHKVNGDYDMSQLRYLYRIMLQGDVPA